MVIRHGTRLPSKKDIVAGSNLLDLKYEILLQHENGKGQCLMISQYIHFSNCVGVKLWACFFYLFTLKSHC